MKSRWSLALYAALLVLLHFLLRVGLGIGRAAPDLLAVLVLQVGRRTTGSRATAVGALLGLLEDATGIHNLGARAIGLGAAGFGASRSRRFLTGEGAGFTPIFLFVGTWLSLAVTWALRRPEAGPPAELLLIMPVDAAWAAIAGTILARWMPRHEARDL